MALIFDEVQCGLGRTGWLFAYERTDVVPDVVTLAKPLAGGLPMGAILVSAEIATAMRPGDHGTTFGGGPFVATVAGHVFERLSEPALLARVRENGAWLGESLRALAARRDEIRAVRGVGYHLGDRCDATGRRDRRERACGRAADPHGGRLHASAAAAAHRYARGARAGDGAARDGARVRRSDLAARGAVCGRCRHRRDGERLRIGQGDAADHGGARGTRTRELHRRRGCSRARARVWSSQGVLSVAGRGGVVGCRDEMLRVVGSESASSQGSRRSRAYEESTSCSHSR